MIKVIVTSLIWIGCFVIMAPTDKPLWIPILAGIGTYQVFSYFVYDLYQILLELLVILERGVTLKEKEDE